MNSTSDRSSRKQKIFDIGKILGAVSAAIAIFIPLMTGILQYRQSLIEESDKAFRSVITKLYSEENSQRLAAASSMGTYIKKGEKYYNQSIDLLINRLSIEIDYNVLNAIRNSLENADMNDYGRIVQKLLNIERNLFIQEYVLKRRMENYKDEYDESKVGYETYSTSVNRLDSLIINIRSSELRKNWEAYYAAKHEYNHLFFTKQAISDFLAVFLGFTKFTPLETIEFSRNSLNQVSLFDLNLVHAKIDRSVFYLSNIINTKFSSSSIYSTIFSNSNMTNSNFSESDIKCVLFVENNLTNVEFSKSKFNEVYFMDSDLRNCNFINTDGLKPAYFYKAKNLTMAKMDSSLKVKVDSIRINWTDMDFINHLDRSSDLPEYLKKEIMVTLNDIAGSETEPKSSYSF
jgi:uncharacterized protein YjbI with pentapeptide repeats